MKEKNILIIGNGFDLALGKQTSYEDFIRFASQIVGYNPDIDDGVSFSQMFNFPRPPGKFWFRYEMVNKIIKQIKTIMVNNSTLEFDDLKFMSNYSEIFFQDLMFLGEEKTLKKHEAYFSAIKMFCENKDDVEVLVNSIKKKYNNISKEYEKHKIDVELLLKNVESNKYVKDKLTHYDGKEYIYDEFLRQFLRDKILKFILSNKENINNWNDLENQISQLVKALSIIKKELKNINTDFIYFSDDSATKSNELAKNYFSDLKNSKHINFIIDELTERIEFEKQGIKNKSLIFLMDEFNQKIMTSLNQLTYHLEFYLAYIDKKENLNKMIQQNRIKIIDKFDKIDNILSFNYTTTAQLQYGLDDNHIHYVHGKQNFSNSSINNNNLVFGIEDNDNFVNEDLINYQKTFQRIIKKTGFKYKSFIETKELQKLDIINVIIFGHSLDILDKEIFIDFFELTKHKKLRNKLQFFIFYFGIDDLKNKVKNLSMFLGKETLINLTSENIIHFIDTKNEKAVEETEKEINRKREEISKYNFQQKQKFKY
ncbi:AbiH family protein [Streptococcus pacificus]|uniref:Bacteriophage abortive infection AbiH n=1 Tax=Streptococcus pacificus TaxID=2740577 RepID=A0ABS0ZKF4_9STRE|nr:AbiH family protein [Streptococcus pacificus]MBJ8326483.1 hypothetical protein [Streptococcus pacificus]